MGCRQSIQPKCIICLKKANTVLFPCGHLCLCNTCARSLSQYDRYKASVNLKKIHINGVICPFCRGASVPTLVYPNI